MTYQLEKAMKTILAAIEQDEKISIAVFANKLEQASQIYPEDYTIGMMSDVVARMSGSNKTTISKTEIKDLYRRLYSRNTKFAEIFKDEIGYIEKQAGPRFYNRDGNDETGNIVQETYAKVADPLMVNALNIAFGNEETKTYSDEVAKKAEEACKQAMMICGIPAKISAMNGNDKFIICRASIDTPKGQTSVIVPIETHSNKALFPSVFVGNNGPENLNSSSVKDYIINNAGVKLTINENMVLSALASANKQEISSVDLAVTKLNMTKEAAATHFETNQIILQKVLPQETEVKTAKYEDSEVDSFAKRFETPVGVANYTFSNAIVNKARGVVLNKLSSLGYKNSQVSVCDSDGISITYAVSINTAAFKVPVKIENGNVFEPSLIISNGSLEAFTTEGIAKTSAHVDHGTAALASDLHGMKASELLSVLNAAALRNDYTKAEEALNVLSESGDNKAYQTGLSMYKNSFVKSASNITKCKNIIKHAHSSQEICSHTGLPISKVYQDNHGNCHPLYRKDMQNTNEGAYFMNSKIFI